MIFKTNTLNLAVGYNFLQNTVGKFITNDTESSKFSFYKIWEDGSDIQEVYYWSWDSSEYTHIKQEFCWALNSYTQLSYAEKIRAYNFSAEECSEIYYGKSTKDDTITFYIYFKEWLYAKNFLYTLKPEDYSIKKGIIENAKLIWVKLKYFPDKEWVSVICIWENNTFKDILSYMKENIEPFQYQKIKNIIYQIKKEWKTVHNIEFSYNLTQETIENIVLFTLPRFWRKY